MKTPGWDSQSPALSWACSGEMTPSTPGPAVSASCLSVASQVKEAFQHHSPAGRRSPPRLVTALRVRDRLVLVLQD